MYNLSQLMTLSHTAGKEKITNNVDKLLLFDFHLKSDHSKISILHYVIRKANYDAFLYLIENRLVDFLDKDIDLATPRQTSLINSAFYRILIKEESEQIRRLIVTNEIELARKGINYLG